MLVVVKQQKLQTHGAIFGGFFDFETRVKGDYNEINRSTPFIYGVARVLTEGDCKHFQCGRYGDLRLNNGNIQTTKLSECRIEI